MVPQQPKSPNPLMGLMRQPKIYIKLPSQGQYWDAGALEFAENGEYPVYSMTAQDELLLKVPDALMNGQAIVDVIQHCVPNIKNAWKIPNLDMDAILIAIRIATYGEMMTLPVKVEEYESDYQVDLRMLLDMLMSKISWNPIVQISDDLTVYVKPINYKSMTTAALQTFEMQKILQLVNKDDVSEEDKIKVFKDSFAKINQMTLGVVNDSIVKVESSQGSTSDLTHIKEFMANVDKDIFEKIKSHIDSQNENNVIRSLKVAVTDDMRSAGVTANELEIPLEFDPSSFFG